MGAEFVKKVFERLIKDNSNPELIKRVLPKAEQDMHTKMLVAIDEKTDEFCALVTEQNFIYDAGGVGGSCDVREAIRKYVQGLAQFAINYLDKPASFIRKINYL